jgi:hypothetical protein
VKPTLESASTIKVGSSNEVVQMLYGERCEGVSITR